MALGPYAQPFVAEALDEGYAGEPVGSADAAAVSAQYFNYRKLSIFGGSNEVQREIISKSLLEL
jgi:alkylation response protein AidB-like acyl-CoA dehydrogenase